MSSFEEEKPFLKRNISLFNDQHKELKWYDNPILQANDSSPVTATTSSSLCTYVWIGLSIIVLLPIGLIVFILFLIFWILPGFGWLYERYAEARDRKNYYPPADEMKPWGRDNKLIHVVHLLAPESRLPPIVYISGMGVSMYLVKPLLKKFAEYMGEPVEIISFDSPGYGASESPTDWNTDNAEIELSLLRRVVTNLKVRKPFILEGASAGATLVQLYRLTYPEDVAGIVLFDPTPSNAFQQGSPLASDFNRASFVCRTIAFAASCGLLRPFSPIVRYSASREFSDIYHLLLPGYFELSLTKAMLLKIANHLRSLSGMMDNVLKLQNNAIFDRRTPLLVVSALNWTKNRPSGGLTREEMRHWWSNSQQSFIRSSDNAGFVRRTDYTHMQCVLDMELAANATKAILTQILCGIVQK
ncbi:hypothetical protein I4U23_022496 [Adineta vaga]|nr:hypothetical protein I4U23_022496 [Adineta vaga]